MSRDRRLFTVVQILAILLIAWVPARAEPKRQCGLAQARSAVPTHPDTTIELEPKVSPQLMKLITTSDGTIAPILQAGGFPVQAPSWLLHWNRKKGRQDGDVHKTFWEDLDYVQQLKLINDVSLARKANWHASRKIPGLRIKDQVELTFKRTTRFLGRDYPAGTHLVDVSRAMSGSGVEYGSPWDIPSLQRVEIHFRSGHGPAGEVFLDARKFLKAAGIEALPMHAHLVGPFPFVQDPASPSPYPKLKVLQGVLLGMRAQHLAEMTSVVEDHHPIRETRVMDGVTIFGAMESIELPDLATYLENSWAFQESHRHLKHLEDRFKIAYVGIHGQGKYDNHALWGFQVRVIRANSKQKIMKPLLNQLQRCLIEMNCFEKEERIQDWLNRFRNTERSWKSFVESAHYNRDWDVLFALARPELLEHVPWARDWVEKQESDPTLRRGNLELKMLFHDWEMDPLYFDKPGKLARIRAEQGKALWAIRNGRSIPAAVAGFLVRSGIYAEVRGAMGPREP